MSQFEKYIFPANNGKNKNAYVNTQNNQDTNIGEYLALGAGGNIFGTALGLGANYLQQQQQLANQKELMQEQNKMNLQNMSMAPSIQKNAMENAGMNPAMGAGNFASAPTVSQGAAGMGGMQLANVFDGIANIIQAAKAPSEIAQTQAQTGLTEAQTGKTNAETEKTKTETKSIFTNMEKIKQETELLFQNTVSAKNANEVFESYNNFCKTYSTSMFDSFREKLKADNAWDNLSPRTKDTIDAIADGEIELDTGGLKGLQELIFTQANMSETDKAMLANALEAEIIRTQLKNPEIKKALANIPVNELKNMQESWKTQRSQRLTQSEQRKLIKEQASGQTIQNTKQELDDINYLISKGRYKEAGMQFIRNLFRTADRAVPAATGALVGGLVGGGKGAATGAAIGTATGLTGNSHGL